MPCGNRNRRKTRTAFRQCLLLSLTRNYTADPTLVVIQLLFVDSILLTVITLGQAAVASVLDDLYPLLISDLDGLSIHDSFLPDLVLFSFFVTVLVL